MNRTGPVLAFLAVLAVATGPATAAERLEKLVASGLQCYEQLNFGCTISKLDEAKKRIEAGEPLSRQDQLLACETLAFAYAAIERGQGAEQSFSWCFALDPSYQLEEEVVGPRVYPHFDRARRALLESKLTLTLPVLPWPDIVTVEPRPDLVVHTPTEILLSGSGGPEQRSHSLGFGVGVAVLVGDDAEDFEPGFALHLAYAYSIKAPLRFLVDVGFAVHTTARDDVKSGFPSTLYSSAAQLGIQGVLTLADIVELNGALLVGGTFAGAGTLSDVKGGLVTLRLGVAVRIGSDLSAGLAFDPSLVMATLSDGALGTSFVLPILAHFDARF